MFNGPFIVIDSTVRDIEYENEVISASTELVLKGIEVLKDTIERV